MRLVPDDEEERVSAAGDWGRMEERVRYSAKP